MIICKWERCQGYRCLIQCDGCGIFYLLAFSYAKLNKRHFCSRKCMGIFRSIHRRGKDSINYGLKGERNHRWKGGCRYYWQTRSREIWEKHHNRKIPKGGVIHHKDGDVKNIECSNLQLMKSNSAHITYHRMLDKLKLTEVKE